MRILLLLCICFQIIFSKVIVTTWNFKVATLEGYKQLEQGKTAMDAIEKGCSACEKAQCEG